MSVRTLRKETPRKKKTHPFLYFGLLALLIAAVPLSYFYFKTTPQKQEFTDSLQESIAISDGFCYTLTNKGFAYASRGGVTVCAPKPLKALTGAFSSPVLTGSGSHLLLYDIDGTRFALLDDSANVLSEKEADGMLIGGALASDGRFAVIRRDTERLTALELYDPSSELLYRRTSGSAYLYCCALSQDRIAAAFLSADSQENTICLISPADGSVLCEYAVGRQTVLSLAFLENDRLCAVCTDELLFLDSEGNCTASLPSPNDCSFGSGFVSALYDGELILYADDGSEIARTAVAEDAQNIDSRGRFTAVTGSGGLQIFDDRLRTLSTLSRDGLLRALVREDGSAVCITETSAEFYDP